MTDTAKLEYLLKKAKVSKKEYAKELGLSLQGLYNKLNNVREFKQTEISATCRLLNLKASERNEIFFAEKVDYLSTKERK
jgi:hypothetical protein